MKKLVFAVVLAAGIAAGLADLDGPMEGMDILPGVSVETHVIGL